MGDISGAVDAPVRMKVADLSLGWSFKQADDVGENSWYPVKKVPSTVHQDLIDNKRCVRRISGKCPPNADEVSFRFAPD